jgi:hypothetical protein
MQLDAPLNPADPSTFYTTGPKGYIDYPALEPEGTGIPESAGIFGAAISGATPSSSANNVR